jgi:hypothetical protein
MLTLESTIFHVYDADALTELAHDVPAARRRVRRIRLGVGTLPSDEASQWEAHLNRQLRSRGSEFGALGYVVALIVYAAYVVFGGSGALPGLDGLTVGVAVVVGGAALGKLAGLLLVNRRLRRSVLALEAMLRAGKNEER